MRSLILLVALRRDAATISLEGATMIELAIHVVTS